MNRITLRILGVNSLVLTIVALLTYFLKVPFLHDLMVLAGMLAGLFQVIVLWEMLMTGEDAKAVNQWANRQLEAVGQPAPSPSATPQGVASKAVPEAQPLREPAPAALTPPVPVAAPAPRVETVASGTGEAVQLLMLLQQKGRFVDFIMDDVTRASEPQLASAARVVHSGCREALKDFVRFEPIAPERESSVVEVSDTQRQSDYSLSGSVPAAGPYRGRLIHRGWKISRMNLPRLSPRSSGDWPPVAPAEVEISR